MERKIEIGNRYIHIHISQSLYYLYSYKYKIHMSGNISIVSKGN